MGVICIKNVAPKARDMTGHTYTRATSGGGPARAVTNGK